MLMTKVERLQTIMLAEIMEGLGLNNEIDPTFIKKMIYAKDEWAISWRYGSGVFGDEPSVTPEAVSETATILSMMSYIEFSVKQLSPEDREQLLDPEALRFHGFDANHDDHFGIATTMIDDLDRFDEFKGRYINSHGAATARTYLRLKPAYDEALRATRGRGFTLDQLQTIAGAAQH